MPLLCISLLALLLLPLSLSCDNQKPPKEVSEDYTPVIETLLTNTWDNITTLLKNSTCSNQNNKPQNCTASNNQDFVSTLHTLNCKMRHLNLSETAKLAREVFTSIRCPCPQRQDLTKAPNKTPEENAKEGHKKHRRRMRRKLCRAKVILSNMTKCYHLLNVLVRTTDTTARSAPLP